jgi:hypothetical protein
MVDEELPLWANYWWNTLGAAVPQSDKALLRYNMN